MEKSVKHVSVPVFVTHEGCPNTCLFCNQKTISGKTRFSLEKVREEIDAHLSTLAGNEDVQIAFFGGSFTAIDRDVMLSLLAISDEYVEKGLVKSVRLSTRPDAVEQDVLDILKEHHVRDIELGIQSMDDRVLELNKRGHTTQVSYDAMRRVVENGFSLTGQMMTGMYGADAKSEIETARQIIKAGAVSARIYPTVVFRDTGLEKVMEKGLFTPLTLDQSVERTYSVYKVLREGGVKVLRVGLCSSDGVRGDEVLSPYHEAMGELVMSREARDYIEDIVKKGAYCQRSVVRIPVSPKNVSIFSGHKKANKKYIEEKYGVVLKFIEE